MHFHRSYLQFFVVLLSVLLTSCMVGPHFHSVPPPQTISYTKSLPPKTVKTSAAGKAGKAQYFVKGQDIPAEWWALFHSPEINALITTGLANSPNLAAAEATLRQAQENLIAQIGNSFYPAINAQLSGERQRFPAASFGNAFPSVIFNLYNASIPISYTLDVFGGARRQVEALCAQVDYQRYQLIGAYLTLTSNIVTTAITIASLQAQIQATQELVQAEEKQLVIMRKQFYLGGVSLENVLSQASLVEQTVATLPVLEQSLQQARHALSVLVGDFPNGPLPTIQLNTLYLPTRIPLSLPSYLVRQRPDIQASEALLHAASAQIGVATANLFPQVTLSGTYGWTNTVPSTLFQSVNKTWNYAAQITQPLFHGGALWAQRRAAIAAYDQSLALYRQTLLQAFQNVADSLRALDNDAKVLHALKEAEVVTRENLILTRKQYRLGGVSYLDLLTAQEQYQKTIISRIRAQATRYSDTAALFQALGGGWWNRTEGFKKLGEKANPEHSDMKIF